MKELTKYAINDFRSISFSACSPDKKHISYIVRAENIDDNKYLGWIYLYTIETGETKQLTYSGEHMETEWLDNSTIYFSKKTKAKGENITSFYSLNIYGGEAKELFDIPVKSANIQPIANNKYVVLGVYDCSPAGDGYNELYEVYDEYPYHHDDSLYSNKLRNRIWIYDSASKELTSVTEPSFSANNVLGIPIRPLASDDKKRIYYTGQILRSINDSNDVYVYNIETGTNELLFKNDYYAICHCVEFNDRIYFNAMVESPKSGKELFSSHIISIGKNEESYRIE